MTLNKENNENGTSPKRTQARVETKPKQGAIVGVILLFNKGGVSLQHFLETIL